MSRTTGDWIAIAVLASCLALPAPAQIASGIGEAPSRSASPPTQRTKELSPPSIAPGQWTWVSGSSLSGQYGIYGTKGVAAPANVPGGRFSAVSWRDSSGNFWLFGGYGRARNGSAGRLNDLWKWDVSSGLWTWISGSDTTNQGGTYGTKGIEGPANVPGAREYSVSWANTSGNLWLFGGYGRASGGLQGPLADLWRFSIATGQWAWMSGIAGIGGFGTYGTKGVAAPGNVPGFRENAVSWTDSNGNLWLFGGYGDGASTGGYLNDLWKLNLASGLWTWVSGSNQAGQGGTYGAKGVAAPANVPGAREDAVSWTGPNGDLWLLGGDESPGNDLWKFHIASGLWTWVSGSSGDREVGRYGTLGVEDPGNVPGYRERSVSWTDASGNLWLFGGYGFAAGQTSGGSAYPWNDLWKFNTASGRWAWMGGAKFDSQAGTYGTKGEPAPTNVPGARYDGVSWIDSNDNLWLFGGSGTRNDLWVWGTTQHLLAITSPSRTSLAAGVAGSFTVTSTGTPVPTLSCTGTLPSGLTFTDNGNGTAILGGTPAAGSAGSYPLVIAAHNGVADDVTQIFTLTVFDDFVAPGDEDGFTSAVIDPAAGFAYFGTYTAPGRIVKIRLSDFSRVGAITLGTGEDYLTSAVIDPAGGFACFGTETAPGRIVKIRLSDFSRVGALALGTGEDYLTSAVIDPAGGFAYFGTYTWPGAIVKVRLSDFTRVGALTLGAGEAFLTAAVADAGAGFAYFGTNTSPGIVTKVRLSDLTRFGAVTLDAGEGGLWSGVVDQGPGFAYFGTGTSPGIVTKVRLSDLTRVGSISLPAGENELWSAVIDPARGLAYFGLNTIPGVVSKVNLSDFTRAGALTLPTGRNYLTSAVIDPAGGFAYFGTYTAPGTVVKVALGTGNGAPGGFFPLTPCRVFDTRVSSGTEAGAPALGPGERRVFSIPGKCGVLVDAKAISTNLTVVGATETGDLRVIGGHLASTLTSVLSIPVSRARANNAIVQLSTGGDGTIAVINSTPGTVHVILDVNGQFR